VRAPKTVSVIAGGSTRQSIVTQHEFHEGVDGRVKPAHDSADRVLRLIKTQSSKPRPIYLAHRQRQTAQIVTVER
jgi:hypothetical protein